MTDPEIHAERVATIDVSVADIDRKLATLEQKRASHSLDAVSSSKSAIQAITAPDAETDKLHREKRTLAAAHHLASIGEPVGEKTEA
jgi:ParB-like chromosome segregation protein Spo0J